MSECTECGETFALADGSDDDGMCHPCAHAVAEGQISAQVSARDLTIRDLRARVAELESLQSDATAHILGLDDTIAAQDRRIAELEAVVEAAKACGTHPVNDDTCGVCGLHFAECEAERASHDDPPFTDANTFPACPGARVRLALAALDAKPSEKGPSDG